MKCPLVAPQSTQISAASIALCPADYDATFASNMESNTRHLRDRREVYALDHTKCVDLFIFKEFIV